MNESKGPEIGAKLLLPVRVLDTQGATQSPQDDSKEKPLMRIRAHFYGYLRAAPQANQAENRYGKSDADFRRKKEACETITSDD
jgi:hypothetical protein